MRSISAPNQDDATPTPRYDVIDALRGFALAGVFLANLPMLSLYEMVPRDRRADYGHAWFDGLVEQGLDLFISGKFVTLFSLLFGLGFAIQLGKVQRTGGGGLPRYVRRLLILAGIGAVHSYFVWWGDILLTYALAGLGLLLFRNASDRMLLVMGIAVALVLTPVLSASNVSQLAGLPNRAEQYARALQVFAGADVVRTVLFNAELSHWTHTANVALLTFVFGRFLLGFWAGRQRLFQAPHEHGVLLRRIFVATALTGVVLTVIYRVDVTRAAIDAFGGQVSYYLRTLVFRGAALALGIAYATGFVLLFQRPAWQRRLRVLVPVGRMALTHYLAQSLIGVLIFYGIGLGIGPKWGALAWLVLWISVFTLQVVVSHVWLRNFRHGPMEWVWRRLMG